LECEKEARGQEERIRMIERNGGGKGEGVSFFEKVWMVVVDGERTLDGLREIAGGNFDCSKLRDFCVCIFGLCLKYQVFTLLGEAANDMYIIQLRGDLECRNPVLPCWSSSNDINIWC
jgi:hypothetical protein